MAPAELASIKSHCPASTRPLLLSLTGNQVKALLSCGYCYVLVWQTVLTTFTQLPELCASAVVVPGHNRSHRCTLMDVMACARPGIQQQGIYLVQVKDTENRGQKESSDVISSLPASGRCRDELREE